MIKKSSALFLSISIVLVLTACGSDKTAESSPTPEINPIAASPTNSPLAEASASPDPTATPQASTEASATPVITAAPEVSTPSATPLATPKATATAKPASTAAPTPSPKPTDTPKPTEAINSEAAEALFKQSCTSCHGVDLAGDFGPNLQKVGGRLTKAQITNQITNGGDSMPPFKKSLKAEEIQTLAVWLAAKK